ncbi:MAG: glycoside hydrolase family 127 protein, partial [Spirochaetales bacterium]|nr:glycoside hydrolase family 127 protein [Spirochaetales bacterium]
FIVKEPEHKWENLAECHELYCAGHMLEAAVALKEYAGDGRLLGIMEKKVALIDSLFGPQEGKLRGYPGHQEIELALVRLYRMNGNRKHLELASFFIDERGREPLYFIREWEKRGRRKFWDASNYEDREYSQVHLPVRKQEYATGHAVRAMYMYCAMADIACETGDESLAAACRRLWDNVSGKQMYITGGIGSSAHREAFSADYDLPNETAYNETCASIGCAFWAFRMLHLDMDGKYGDVLEKQVYNGIPSGISTDGTRFFYVNPLQVGPVASRNRADHSHVKTERQQWFGCACCPPNLARFFASIGQYVCSCDDDGVYIHLFEESEISVDIHGTAVGIDIQGNYPWEGTISVSLHLESEARFLLAFRVPGWCKAWSLRINGEPSSPPLEKGYAKMQRNWKDGDRLELELDMPVTLVRSHPLVQENIGKVAIMKGPVVYCLEECDNGKNLSGVSIQKNPRFTEKWISMGTNGKALTLETVGSSLAGTERAELYTLYSSGTIGKPLLFIPYSMWGNRGGGEMRVWIREGC